MPAASNTLCDLKSMQVVLGEFLAGTQRSLFNPFLHLMAQEHRRMLSARMMALDKEAMKQKLPECDYLVSRKIDGEFNLLVVDGDSACIVNPGGTVRAGLPLLADAVKLVRNAGLKQAVLAGELYFCRSDKRPRVHDVSRVARQPQDQGEIDALCFAVFDIIEIDQNPPPRVYAETWKLIDRTFGKGKAVHAVETVRCKALPDIEKHFGKWVEQEGAEGLVLRSDTAGLFKVKPRCSLDVAVLGFTEGTDDRTGLLHDLLVAVMRPDSTFHILGRVGGGFTDEQRRQFLSDLKDMPAESEYTEVNDAVAYQMVRPEWVIEISCLDLISQNTRGGFVERMILNWDSKGTKYGIVRRLPLASPISPQFVRRREDKSIIAQDLRIQQVADVVEVPMANRDARQLALPGSQMLKREVYTKVLKGQTMVRKLLLWKTNKEGEVGGGEWPGYVAYLCDFSPNRKTPLEREIRVSNSQAQIEQLYQQLKEENIVKGWVAV